MPTESGLRLFVDGMMQVAEPTADERATIEARLAEPGPIERALETTSTLLSDITGAAGMVMVPTRESRLAQMSLVSISNDRALAVLVGEDGHVENRVVELPGGVPQSALEQVSNYMSAHLTGRTLPEAAAAIGLEIASGKSALDAASQDLVERGLAVWSEDAAKRPALIVRGQANLLDDFELWAISSVSGH